MSDEFEHVSYADTLFTLKHVARLLIFEFLACFTAGVLVLKGDALGMWSYYGGCVICLSFVVASLHSFWAIVKGDNHA